MPETTATLVDATPTTTPSWLGATLTLTTSRTATLPTATRRTVASMTAKECTRHWVQIKKHPLRITGKRSGPSSRSRPSYIHTRTRVKVGSNCTPKVQVSIKPEEIFGAGLEGHHELLGKVGVSEEPNVDLLQNPLSVLLPILPLAGLRDCLVRI